MKNFYWKLKTWKLDDKERMLEWKKKNELKYEMRDVFINNEYAVEYRCRKEL